MSASEPNCSLPGAAADELLIFRLRFSLRSDPQGRRVHNQRLGRRTEHRRRGPPPGAPIQLHRAGSDSVLLR